MSAIDFASEPFVDTAQGHDGELQLWLKRAKAAHEHRRKFEKPWMEGQAFASGQQWAEYNTRTHRVLVPDEPLMRKKRTHDVLMQYVWTVVGALAADDFRPQFLTTREGVQADDRADYVNKAIAYGWEEEWDGDEIVHDLLLYLVTYGTGGIRCRVDRSHGPLIAPQVPHLNGQPILDPAEQRSYMADTFANGVRPVTMAPLREACVVWEPLSPFNLLPPPGVDDPRNFPWEIVVRPVAVEELRQAYPGVPIRPEPIDSMDVLGSLKAEGQSNSGALADHALVYTGYERPGPRNPTGQTALFTRSALLEKPKPSLPYKDSTGITYFWYWRVPRRFWGRAFMEPGMGPQKTLNLRETQVDRIIERGLPYVIVTEAVARKIKIPEGIALELVVIPDAGAEPMMRQGIGPGQWMSDDIERLRETIADATGVKQVALGENPASVTNFAQLSLLKDSEATKLGPISQRFNNGLARLTKDSLEAMRSWPQSKKLLIVGEENELEALEWDQQKIPDEFLIRASSKGSQPRGIGAEIAKVTDLWNAAVTCGLVLRNPTGWIEWFHRSIEAGKAQELPDDGSLEQRHKAALEDIVMEQTGQPVPVAPYDDAQIHVEEHSRKQEQLSESSLAGDQRASLAVQAIEQHKQMHLAQAQQAASQSQPSAPGGSPSAPPQPSPAQLQAGGGPPPSEPLPATQ